MTKRIGGFRRKSRHKLAKLIREHGKLSIAKYMQSFGKGDKVCLVAESSVQKGMYFPRFHGRTGVVIGKQGECYAIQIDDLGMEKTVIVHPVHLKKG